MFLSLPASLLSTLDTHSSFPRHNADGEQTLFQFCFFLDERYVLPVLVGVGGWADDLTCDLGRGWRKVWRTDYYSPPRMQHSLPTTQKLATAYFHVVSPCQMANRASVCYSC